MDRSGTEPLRPHDPVRIGAYQVVGRLGEGGMGTVYLALTPAQRPVAIKVVKPQYTVDERFAERFHAEVDNARKVASFCTAQVLDNGNTDDGLPYLVTEYIPGLPLSRQIARFGALDPGPLTGVALGVAAALAAIHAAGLVHRDLKPSNVILSISGPRVIDFGISRALDSTTSFTRSGELLGTPGWWAPEQVRGDSVTPAADVFAWGCLVAYAGNGRHPYGSGDALTLAARLLNGPPDLGALPEPLLELAGRATDADPARRPAAQELLLALVGGTGGPMPVRVDPPTLVGTEIVDESLLKESWQAPQNVADLAPAPAPAPADGTARDVAADVAADDATDPVGRMPLGALSAPVTAPPPGHPVRPGPAEPGRWADRRAGDAPDERIVVVEVRGPGPREARTTPGPLPGRPGERRNVAREQGQAAGDQLPRGRKWLIPVLLIIAAIGISTAVFAIVHPPGTGATDGGRAGRRASVAGPPVASGPDDGRRVALGGPLVQAFVPLPPACGATEYAGVRAGEGRVLCVIRLSMLNLGGVAVGDDATGLRLVDDQGGEHAPGRGSTNFPATLNPGDRIDGVVVVELPRDRAPARLVLRKGREVRL